MFLIFLQSIPSNLTITAPWAILSIFLIPLSLCVQLLLKLWEVKEQNNLSREEKRRLNILINKKTQIFISIILYCVLSAVIGIVLFVFFTSDTESFKIIMILIGFLLGSSSSSIWLIIMETKKVAEFKAKLKEREESKKMQKLGLKRLNTEEQSNA